MDNVCLCEAPRIKAKFRRTWECTICGKPEQPSKEAAHPAPAPVESADLELIRRLVIPMVRERSREPGDAWHQAEQALAALSSSASPSYSSSDSSSSSSSSSSGD